MEGADVPGPWGVGSLDTQAPTPAHRPAPESALLGGACPSEWCFLGDGTLRLEGRASITCVGVDGADLVGV